MARRVCLEGTRFRAFGASARRARGRPIGKRERRAPGSRALRPVPSGIDVQARDGIGGAASACRSARTTFTCARLPDGRVGAKINGWNRPVRDDVMDQSARDDRRARRLRAFVQRVLRAARRQARIAGVARHRQSTGDFADAGSRRCGACAPDASADRLRPGRCRRDAPEAGARVGRRRVERRAARHSLRAG